MGLSDYLTITEAAEFLGLSQRWISDLVRGQWADLGLVKVGRSWLIPRAVVENYSETRRKPGFPDWWQKRGKLKGDGPPET